MALFGSLGTALGAAASGALTGKNRGEAEAFRRQQIATQNERANNLYQLQLAKLSATQKDPDQKIREAALRHADILTRFRKDPQHAQFFHENPDVARQMDDELSLAYGVGTGTLDVGRWNPVKAQSIEAGLETASGGGAGAPAPEPPGLGATGEQVRQHAFLAEHGGLPQPPPTALAPSNVGVVRKEAGLGPGPLAFQYPEPPAPASITNPASVAGQSPPSAAPAPAKPKLTQEGILAQIDALNKATPPEKLPLETPKAYETRVQHWQTNNHQQIVQLTQLLGAVPKGQILTADAATRPATNQARLRQIGASTNALNSTAEANRALLPGKVALQGWQMKNFASQITARAQQLDQGNRRLSESERHNRATELLGQINAATARANSISADEGRKARMAQIKFVQDHFDELEVGKDLRAEINALAREETAQIAIGGLKTPAGGGQMGPRAHDRLQEIFESLHKKAAAKATPSSSATVPTPTVKNTPLPSGQNRGSGATGVPRIEGPPVTKGERLHIKEAVRRGVFEDWVKGLPPAAQKRARAIAAGG